MIDRETLLEVFDIAERRRTERRRFLRMAGTAAAVTGAAGLLAACNNDDKSIPTSTPTPTATATSSLVASDVDILNFALNLEYLEANYYSFAAFGSGLNATLQTGTGTQGAVTGGAKVPFADASVAAYAREIAADENQHVLFLRQQLGSSAVAMPAINIDGGATGAFTAAARAAGVVDATSGTFNPYASDENWLLGGMLLSDVGVTAYKGSASLISSSVILDAAAGILAVEAYHSGLLRTLLYRKGLTMPALRTNADKIANARDTIDNATDDDVGISPMTVNGGTASSIVLADNNGIVYGRSAGDVLNVAFLNAGAVTSGGFFPAGVNGNIKTSTAG